MMPIIIIIIIEVQIPDITIGTCITSQVVMEFEERPVFPPPLIFMAHMHRTVKYLRRWWNGKPPLHDKGLKLFLDTESLERVHDFEEECVYGYIRDKEQKEQMTTEVCSTIILD